MHSRTFQCKFEVRLSIWFAAKWRCSNKLACLLFTPSKQSVFTTMEINSRANVEKFHGRGGNCIVMGGGHFFMFALMVTLSDPHPLITLSAPNFHLGIHLGWPPCPPLHYIVSFLWLRKALIRGQPVANCLRFLSVTEFACLLPSFPSFVRQQKKQASKIGYLLTES